MKLYDYQLEALKKMKNGCILNGGVGSGKSITSLAYYHKECGGKIEPFERMSSPKDLYIITTARKRDCLEWEGELARFGLSTNSENSLYSNKVVVDSWNNIKKYIDVKNSFFIFDEQRLVGKGTWVRIFLKIVLHNNWILLSATPGDQWSDYIPVFIANGFYRNRTEFNARHVVYRYGSKYPQIERYINTERLEKCRNAILVNMKYSNKTVSHHEDVWCSYEVSKYKETMKTRWDYIQDCPIENASRLCYLLRRICNTSPERLNCVLNVVSKKKKVIIFYNFDYELELLKSLPYSVSVGEEVTIAEWNGHTHEMVPTTDSWVYLVQYAAGNEGWNCITTDTIIFFSQNYSYKATIQAAGRIDRLNTPFTDLYYYHLKSRSGIDLAISRSLSEKKEFNERRFVDW